ncbi:tetratricopeptide repeat protein [Candidatus Poribacteria bacterium]|nr:tetratricopeptide repeat protein [Candidatus Poribacteria bacterium]
MKDMRWALIVMVVLMVSSCGKELNNPFDPEAGSPGEAYFAYGLDRFNSGDFKGALGGFQKSVEIDPTFALGHAGIGWSNLLSGDPIIAIAEFSLALQNQNDLPDALLGLAAAALAVGDYERAESNAEKLISMFSEGKPKLIFADKPLERGYLILAESRFYLGRYSEAVSALENLDSDLKLDPSDDGFPEKFMEELTRLREEMEGERGN